IAATEEPPKESRKESETEEMAGEAYVPLYRQKRAPLKPQAVTLGTGQRRRTVEPPEKEPIRREHIMDLLQREFGMVVYQGKPFKFREALGFFRPKNFEVRIKHKNDLEVTAHEVFHWIDRTYPEIRSEEHTSELQSRENLVCRLLLEKKKTVHSSLTLVN